MWGSGRGPFYGPWFYPFPIPWDSEDEDYSDQEMVHTHAELEGDWLSDDEAETEGGKAGTSGYISQEWSDHADVEPFVHKTHPCCPCRHKVTHELTDTEEDDYSSGIDTSDSSEDELEEWIAGDEEKSTEVHSKGCPSGRVVPSLSKEESKSLGKRIVEGSDSVSVELPQEIMTLILSKLPFHELSRFRTVCKAWNGLLIDPEFAVMYLKKTAGVPYCVMFDHYIQGYSIYSPVTHAWRLLPRSFFSFSSPKFCLLASVGGILLYEGVGYEQRTFFLVNPVNKSERRLPLLEAPELDTCSTVYYAQIAMDRDTDRFKVLIILVVEGKPLGSELKYQVYDSCSDSWEMFGSLPANLGESDFRGAVLIKGTLYCLAHIRYSYVLLCISQQNSKGETISDSKGGEAFWNSSTIKLLDREFLFLDLFEHEGKLMLGGRTDDLDHDRNLQFWRYELGFDKKSLWVEVHRLPKKLRSKFSVLEEFATVLVQGDYIWASAVVEKYTKRHTIIDGSVMVMSSFSESNWCLIPNYSLGCPGNCNRDYCGDLGRRPCTLFLFEPRIDLLL